MDDRPQRLRTLALAAVASILTAAPIVYAHRTSLRTWISAHGFLHLALVDRFAPPWEFAPPANPFFANETVPYYWLFHYVAARLAHGAGVHPLVAIEAMILGSVAVLWLSAVALGKRLYGKLAPGLAIGLFALAGANALGFVFFLLKVAVRGTGSLADDPNHLWGIAHPVLSMARFNDPFALYGPLLAFFYNVTSRPLALSLLLAVAFWLFVWLERGRVGSLVALVLSSALCSGFSVLVGIPAAACVSAGLVAAHRLCRPPALSRSRLLAGIAALLLGPILALPAYANLFGRGTGGIRIDPSWTTITGVIASGTLLVVLAAAGTARTPAPRREFLFALLAAGLTLMLASMVFVLPTANECNFYHAAVILLAIPAAACLVPAPDWSPRRVVLSWVAAVFVLLPTPGIIMFAYLDRPSVPVRFSGTRLERVPADAPLARLYGWARAMTPGDAVFVLDPRLPFVTAAGNMPEFPVLAGREMFTTYRTSYLIEPNPDAGLRHDLAVRLVDGTPLDAAQHAYLRDMKRPVYVVTMHADRPEHLAALQQAYGPPAFHDREVAAFALR
ncbi:hypothetical protein L6Q96_09205 [Candidatus Binatia bacterium]|nr:hypothetical protein [Candidatus Binatia bacterium]